MVARCFVRSLSLLAPPTPDVASCPHEQTDPSTRLAALATGRQLNRDIVCYGGPTVCDDDRHIFVSVVHVLVSIKRAPHHLRWCGALPTDLFLFFNNHSMNFVIAGLCRACTTPNVSVPLSPLFTGLFHFGYHCRCNCAVNKLGNECRSVFSTLIHIIT